MKNTKEIEDRLYPMLRADNAEVVIYPWDRKYGALLVGGQGTGKTSALLSFYLNDLGDADAAPIVIDPKSELSRICLRITPRDCGKRVWFLDLGHPAFGMSPLRLIGDRPLGDRGRADRREHRRRAPGHQREPDLPVLAPLPLPRGDRRDRDRPPRGTPRQARGRLHAPAPRQGRVPRGSRRGVRGPGRPRPDRRVLPLRATRRPTHGHQPRRRAARRAAQQDLRPHRRPTPTADSSTIPPTSRCGRSSRRATS